jgi:hypothetical protein
MKRSRTKKPRKLSLRTEQVKALGAPQAADVQGGMVKIPPPPRTLTCTKLTAA